MNYIEFRYTGVKAVGGVIRISPMEALLQSVSIGDVYTASAYISNSLVTGVTALYLEIEEVDDSRNGTALHDSANLLNSSWTRQSVAATINGVGTTHARIVFITNTITAGTTVDFIIRIGQPQFEKSSSATAPIDTSTGAVTVTDDVVSQAGSNAQNLFPSRFTNTNTIRSDTIAFLNRLIVQRHANTNVFNAPTVTRFGRILPPLFSNTDTFYAPIVARGGGGVPQVITDTAPFINSNVVVRRNWVRNNDMISAIAGSPGLLPSFWSDNVFSDLHGAQALTAPRVQNNNQFYSETLTGGGYVLILTITQLQASWPANTPKNTNIASMSVARSDGQPFTGQYVFVGPSYNDGLQTLPDGGSNGVFALKINPDFTGFIIINPNGPGLEQPLTTITDHVDIQAIIVPVIVGAMGPLLQSVDNSNYFAKPGGTPVYLTGSHTWNNLQDEGPTFPPAAFDYTAYLNWMQANNFNFMRMWMIGEQPFPAAFANPWYNDPNPWPRPGPGTAADGKAKFLMPLTRSGTFNQTYFNRLRQRVIDAGNRGIYVSIMLFQGWSMNDKANGTNPWPYHPFNSNNNANSPVINGDPSGTGVGNTSQTTSGLLAANVLTAQQAYAQKVVDTVNDLDNVLYEISNESDPSSAQWQYNMITFIKNYENGLVAAGGKRHPVGMTATWQPSTSNPNSIVFNSPADWVSPINDVEDYFGNPPANNGSKVVLNDTDHIGNQGDATWPWRTFTRGNQPIFMDDLGQTGINTGGRTPGFNPAIYNIRAGMTQTASYAARLDLKTAKPNGGLTTTQYMLASPGVKYLAYAPGGGSFTVDLSAAPSGKSFTVEWFNPSTGAAPTFGTPQNGGAVRSFTSPFGGSPSVLFLY